MSSSRKRNQQSSNKDHDHGKESSENGKDTNEDMATTEIIAVFIPETKKTKIVSSTEEAEQIEQNCVGLFTCERKTFKNQKMYENFLKEVQNNEETSNR